MAYPDSLLSEGEQVVAHKHPHFKMLIFPTLALVVTAVAGGYLAWRATDFEEPWNTVVLITVAVVGGILIIWLFLAPFVRWRTTHFVVTTDRVIVREGVIKRTGIDIPMARIHSVRFEHGLVTGVDSDGGGFDDHVPEHHLDGAGLSGRCHRAGRVRTRRVSSDRRASSSSSG